jgi:hypothetical protein
MPELNDLPSLGEVLLYLLYPIRRDALDWDTLIEAVADAAGEIGVREIPD